MASLLGWLFGDSNPAPTDFRFVVADSYQDAPMNQWYRLRHWQFQNLFCLKSEWDRDWREWEKDVPVVGVTFNNREQNFYLLACKSDFLVSLVRVTDNPHDPNAIEVFGSATLNGARKTLSLGHLSRETSLQLRDEPELDARPYSVWLPTADCVYGLRLRILTRSEAFRRRRKKPPPIPSSPPPLP